MAFKKTVRRVVRKAGRVIKKRYFKGKGYARPNIGRMAKDLAIVKQMVNAEKEIYNAHNVLNTVVSTGTPYIIPITNIAEGTAHGQRDGTSVKLHGFRWNIRATQQANGQAPQWFKCWLVKYVGPRGSTPSISTFLKPDFDGNYTYYSNREEDHYTSYRVVSAMSGKIQADNISGQTMYTLKNVYGRFTKGAHQRYSGAAETTLLTDQMYIISVCSSGTSAGNSGMLFDSQLQISFYDN